MISQGIIKRVVKTIVANYETDKIILFGSYAKGNANNESDMDILIISDKEKEKPRRFRGLELLYKLRKFHFSKDILIYTNDEIKKYKDIKVTFVSKVLKEGIILYENICNNSHKR